MSTFSRVACLLALVVLIMPSSSSQLNVLKDFPPKISTFDQTVDHFSFQGNNKTFKQRYFVYDEFWLKGGRKGPILFYMGGEGQLDSFYNDTSVVFSSIGPETGGMILFVEHRYYGKSQVVGPTGDFRYLSIEQALADFADIIVYFKNEVMDSPNAKTVLFGGSYGGMMVGWFRLKYPHITAGGVMSSAPVDFYRKQGKQAEFWRAVQHTFEANDASGEAGVSCMEVIDDALKIVKNQGSQFPLHDIFNTCEANPNPKKLFMYARGAVATLAMVNYPFPWLLTTTLPGFPVRSACAHVRKIVSTSVFRGLDKAGSELLKLKALNSVVDMYVGPLPCKNTTRELVGPVNSNEVFGREGSDRVGQDLDMIPWNYQACTELTMEPLTSDYIGFYPPDEEDFEDFYKNCRAVFGEDLQIRESFVPITYGLTRLGKSKHVAYNGLNNVVIVDGEWDPWRAGSLEIEDCEPMAGQEKIRACQDRYRNIVKIPAVAQSAHHQDLVAEHPEDSDELRMARRLILAQVKSWIGQGSGSVVIL